MEPRTVQKITDDLARVIDAEGFRKKGYAGHINLGEAPSSIVKPWVPVPPEKYPTVWPVSLMPYAYVAIEAGTPRSKQSPWMGW